MTIWHDKDGKVVEFTAEQTALDADVLGKFGGVEVGVSKGQNPRQAPLVGNVEQVLESCKKLPRERAAHWREELVRIGALDAPAKEAPKKEDPKKDDDKK